MILHYSNVSVTKEVAKELDISEDIVNRVFEHRCNYTFNQMQSNDKFIRWLYLGTFTFNPNHKKKYKEVMQSKLNIE